MRRTAQLLLLVTSTLGAACSDKEAAPPPAVTAAAPAGSDLTPFQLEHGIGPITEEVTLGPIDKAMAESGKQLFETKCSACHKMTDRYVGPPLGEVTIRRKPAFIMNQILNPEGMYTKHPVIKQLLGEYMTQMPNIGLTQEQARQVLEYLRTQAPSKAAS
jgi:cytochrome c1